LPLRICRQDRAREHSLPPRVTIPLSFRHVAALLPKREKLAEGMRDLESRQRDAHPSLRTSLAEMNVDIREHVRLSSNLEMLQNLTEKREHEAAAILQRLDSRRDMASRIREEHQYHEDSIRKMESEFSSSGKELQGILQTLGILL
jgi:phytoene dehydrogenase-like protein